MSRFARKVDKNQAEVVAALRAAGCLVQSLASVGGGCPDLLVGYAARWTLLEVKDGRLPVSARRLTPKEMAFKVACALKYLPCHVVECPEDALRACGVSGTGLIRSGGDK